MPGHFKKLPLWWLHHHISFKEELSTMQITKLDSCLHAKAFPCRERLGVLRGPGFHWELCLTPSWLFVGRSRECHRVNIYLLFTFFVVSCFYFIFYFVESEKLFFFFFWETFLLWLFHPNQCSPPYLHRQYWRKILCIFFKIRISKFLLKN